jgi:polysaccharide export outer membrane protein
MSKSAWRYFLLVVLLFGTALILTAQGLPGQAVPQQSETQLQQSLPVPQLQMPQNPSTQNTIRNNPYDELMRTQQQQQQQQQLGQQPPMASAVPEEPTQFQKFIAESLGRVLPIYGRDFFLNVPTTFAPVDHVPVSADYVIGPGDEIVIHAWGQVDVNYRDVVDRNGNLYLPKVGTLHLAGLRYDQLRDYVQNAISRIFKNFQLNTSLGSLRSIQIYVVGYANRPGSYTVSSMSTLVNAVFAAGGPAQNGSMRHILLKRAGQTVTDFDLYDLLLKGDKSRDHQLLPGDVIYFAPVGPQVALAGSVNQPAIYELQDQSTLGELLDLAGGTSIIARDTEAFVERIDAHQLREVADIRLQGEGLKRELRDGDLIRVVPISARFKNAVTLRGNVALPGRYPWHEGMRVKDLIPDLYTLITENYWMRQNQAIGSQWSDYRSENDCRSLSASGSPGARCVAEPSSAQSSLYRSFGQGGAQGAYPTYAGSQPQQPGQTASALSPPLPYSASQTQPGTAPTSTSTLAGAQQTTSVAQSVLQAEIQQNAPDINWDYALIERLDLERLTTRLIPFDLRNALLDSDSEDNHLLRPGDVVTIFSQQDMRVPTQERSKYVYLEGEVKAPGVYRAEPGETLRHLLERAGGLTTNAYLFGAEFTRESAQREQQVRLDQAINQFQQEIQRNAAEQTAAAAMEGNVSTGSAVQAQLQNQQQLLSRLKQVQAGGRVVLGIRPWDDSVEAIPAIALEDGDRLVIPSRPSYVNVVGAVYNTSSYLYSKQLRTRDYLREAGGGTRVADPDRTFVVRADGSVISHVGGPFTGNLMSARLMPGDTIVVPEHLYRPGFMKGLRDWSQILGQIGLAAAAINVLR